MVYNGDWLDEFGVEVIKDSKLPNMYGKIVLKTPSIDYVLIRGQFEELKKKINEV